MIRCSLLVVLLHLFASDLGAQLRPLEPLNWESLDSRSGALSVGAGVFSPQRASLAGTEGRLFELGAYSAVAHFGRISIQLNGTALRLFYDRSVFAPATGGALPDADSRRLDTGDHQVHTLIRLTPEDRPAAAILRFGVRLPTTDNFKGLDRDQTDFVVTVGGRLNRGAWTAAGEFGMGVYGTRDPEVEQVDPLLYSLLLGYRHRWAAARLLINGQYDTRTGMALRGTEDQAELRLEVEAGWERFVRVSAVWGWTAFSPGFGFTVATGVRF